MSTREIFSSSEESESGSMEDSERSPELDEATHEPGTHIEQTGDIQTSEAIETAFTELVEANLGEMEGGSGEGVSGGVGGAPSGAPGIAPEGGTAGDATEEKVGGGGKSSLGSETYDPQKSYSGVTMTQGEVLEDEDWNEESGDVDPSTFEGIMKKLDATFAVLDEEREKGLEDMRDMQAVKAKQAEEEAERLKDKYGSDDSRTPPPEEVSSELLDSNAAQMPLNIPIETPQEDLVADLSTISPTGAVDSGEEPQGGGETKGGTQSGSKGGSGPLSGTPKGFMDTQQGETSGQATGEGKEGSVNETTEMPPKDGVDGVEEPQGGGETKGGTKSGSKGGSGPISGTPKGFMDTQQGETSGQATDEGKGGATGDTSETPPKNGFDSGDGGSEGGTVKRVSGERGGMSIDFEGRIAEKTNEGDDDVMVDLSQILPTDDDDEEE